MNANNFSDNSIKYINECYLTSYDICTYPHVLKFAICTLCCYKYLYRL